MRTGDSAPPNEGELNSAVDYNNKKCTTKHFLDKLIKLLYNAKINNK